MRNRTVAITLLVLSGCRGQSDEAATAPSPAASLAGVATPTLSPQPASPPAAAARSVKQTNDLFEFSYAYPAEVAAIPALRAALESALAKSRTELASESRTARSDAREAGFPYRPYGSDTQWTVVTELPGWLSLKVQNYAYTGGAHGMHWFEAQLWDKSRNALVESNTVFVSKPALSAAIRQPFCEALNRERAKRREDPIEPGDENPFNACIDPAAYPVILGSTNRQAFDRFAVLVPPYEAGPYAEGDYEITLPVTPALVQAVKPEFRNLFRAAR